MLTLAVSKGRIFRAVAPLLAKAGFAPRARADGDADAGRRLIAAAAQKGARLIFCRASDAPIYVACGAAQAGIAGRDALAEEPLAGVLQPLDLGIARCRLVAAAKADFDYDAARRRGARVVVATKYVNLARAHFARRGVTAEIVKLRGNIELAPKVGLCDIVVDLTDTGATLRANGLVERETLLAVSSQLVVNRAAQKRRPEEMRRLVARFAAARADGA